jgi:hypothetical protein
MVRKASALTRSHNAESRLIQPAMNGSPDRSRRTAYPRGRHDPALCQKLAVGVNGEEEPPSPPSHMHLWGFARPRPRSDSGGVLVSGKRVESHASRYLEPRLTPRPAARTAPAIISPALRAKLRAIFSRHQCAIALPASTSSVKISPNLLHQKCWRTHIFSLA